jgi:serine phosphatase RsbU (regulator of sigma subunit)
VFERLTRPLVDEEGAHRGRIWFFRDATDERRREAGQRLLADAGKSLASSLGADDALVSVLDDTLRWNADVSSLFLTEGGEAVRMVAIRARDPQMQAVADEILARFPTFDAPVNPILTAVGGDRSMILNTIDDAMLEPASGGGPVFELARRLGLRSVLIAPVRSHGEPIGAIAIGMSSSDRRYDERDAAVLEDVAERIAVTLDNARLYRERDRIAHTLQASLLPTRIPEIDGLEVSARYRAAGEGVEVGGDFYDVFEIDGSWLVAIGDVCGKGPTAAALTAVARHTIRAGAMMARSPSEILSLVNDAILRGSADERFCTVLLAKLDRRANGFGVRMSSGGHPPALVLRADGELETIDEPGTLLGLFEDPHLTEADVALGEGDTMILYTDGVTDEQRDGEEFGETRLYDVVRACAGLAPEAIAERLVQEVVAFRPEAPRDDIAVLVVRSSAS